MALDYSEELLKWSKGGGETRIVQLHTFPQVIIDTKHTHVCTTYIYAHARACCSCILIVLMVMCVVLVISQYE